MKGCTYFGRARDDTDNITRYLLVILQETKKKINSGGGGCHGCYPYEIIPSYIVLPQMTVHVVVMGPTITTTLIHPAI